MAQAAWERGERLHSSDVPDLLLKPVVQIAVRWARCPYDAQTAQPQVFWAPIGAIVGGTRPVNDRTHILPLSVSPGDSLLKPYGETPPFDDIALVATFPLDVLRTDLKLIITKSGTRDGRPGACWRIGNILPAELAAWR